ncbi:protein SHORTAGE IN CHIASMATA 1 [Prunus yedoensis var. nudiflora]|uniref:Protein SHORTAGE IN CHIASMATA 1 n=1 Tax=Prunus yedoensis var. nudiflora TaxID=2094558 RepID=A0A314XIW0_PRUYE|nr:protein SHORTAGE IN CHIASMATA 1 [Prunus yedoensis var. nudiflora]
MRTRYLNIDYFTVTPIQALETLTFLHLPIPHLAHSHLSTINGLHFLHFDSVLEVSLQIEQLPIETALSKFFSDVLPQSIDLDAPDFEIVGSSPTSRSFGSGSHVLQFSEKAEVLKKEKELENQLTFASGPLEIEIRKKDNGRTDEEKDAIKYNVLQFETQELDVFLENAYIYEKEEIQIISEVQETQINLEMFNLTIEYPWEVHESVHTVEDFHSEYPMDQKAYLFEDDGSYKDEMHFYQTFPLLEANEITLQTLTGLSVEDELSSVYENVEPQHWAQKDNLNGKELLGNKEYGILEQCLRSDVGSLDITPEMDLLSMVEISQIQGNITYQGVSLGACFQSMSPVVFQEFQILDLDTSHNFEVLFTAQTANEPETCHWMFNGDMNFSTLIVSHELALVDETFKSLPVPVLSDHEKISSSYVVIEKTLNDLKPQPLSASDRIYLDWHLLEKDKFNFQTYSSHQKMLEDMSSLSTCFEWDSYDEGKLVYNFAFSDDAVDGLNTEENKEIQELLSDGIPMLGGHLGDGSAKLSDDNFPQHKNGEDIDKRSAERASSFFKSMSQLNDIDFFLNPRKASAGENSNCAVTKVDNTATFAKGEQSHSTSAPVGNINDQKSKELLNIFHDEEKNDVRSKEAANEVEARSMPLPNPSIPSAMDTERTQQNMMSFPEMVIIVNTQNLDKEMIVSRRSTYQKILAKEKEGAQKHRKESNCLDEASSCLPLCIEDIATNVLTLLSFTFSGCIMVFEGEQSFLSTVMESSDGLYAAAASLGIDLQLFNSYSSELTDEIILSCMGYATKLTRWIYPQMPESETLAESFLTKFPSEACSKSFLNGPMKPGSVQSKNIKLLLFSVFRSGFGRFRKRRKYNGSPDKYEIQMNGLLHLEQLNRFTDDILDPSTISKLSDSCMSKSPKRHDEFRKPKFSQNDLLDQEQGLDMDMMMSPFRVLETYDSQIAKGPQSLNEIKRSCLSSEGKLSGQKHRSDMPIMNKFDLNTMKNSEILHEDLRGEVIDLTDSPVLDEDFSSIANSMKFSSLMPELEIDSTRKSKAARKLSFNSSSHRTFPTAAEINSSSTVWHSVKDPRKSSQVGANNNSDTDLEHDVFSLRHRNKPLEKSFMQRSGGKSQGLHLHENDISHYGGTPLKNALRSAIHNKILPGQ